MSRQKYLSSNPDEVTLSSMGKIRLSGLKAGEKIGDAVTFEQIPR